MLKFSYKANDSYIGKVIQVNWFSVYLYSTISAEEPNNIGQLKTHFGLHKTLMT